MKRVIIFPCAGGIAGNFSKWKEYCDGMTVIEYSGHWTRYDKKLATDFEELVRDSLSQIKVDTDDRVVIFGHSMGAIAGYLAAQELLKKGITVTDIYISACPPPCNSFLPKFTDDEAINDLLRLIRQVPEKTLKSSFFKGKMMPSIRNDLKIFTEYVEKQKTLPSINANIHALSGDADPIVQRTDIEKWKDYTETNFELKEYSGNHFFLYNKAVYKELLDEIKSLP